MRKQIKRAIHDSNLKEESFNPPHVSAENAVPKGSKKKKLKNKSSSQPFSTSVSHLNTENCSKMKSLPMDVRVILHRMKPSEDSCNTKNLSKDVKVILHRMKPVEDFCKTKDSSKDVKVILRRMKPIDYKEESFCSTPTINRSDEETNQKVPIYRRLNLLNVHQKRRVGNEYDFIPDSDEDKDSDVSFHINTPKIKKRKVTVKTQPINGKLYSKKGVGKKCLKNASNYGDKINRILINVSKRMKSPNSQKIDKNDENTVLTSCKSQKVSCLGGEIESDGVASKANKRIFNSTQLGDSHHNYIFENESPIISRGNKLGVNDGGSNPEISSFNDNCDTVRDDCDSSISEISDSPNGNKNFFGFTEDDEKNQSVVTSRAHKGRSSRSINILENIILNKSRPRHRNRSSWRCDLDYTRNPHFLQLKKNSLPSLNQELVLDHRFEDSITTTNVSIPEIEKSPVQTSILNYIDTNKEHSQENPHNLSLFNMEEFTSPIKVQNTDKENFISRRSHRLKKECRRNVLGVRDENVQVISTPTPDITKRTSTPLTKNLTMKESDEDKENICNKLGLNFTSEIIEENICRNETAKPFRMELNVKKKYERKQMPDKFTQPVRTSELHRLIGDDTDFQAVVEKDGLESDKICLFDEIEVPQNNTKSYKPRPRKKFGFEMDISAKKNTQCKLSKEAKKWIKEFKEMCSEVDKTQLEIE